MFSKQITKLNKLAKPQSRAFSVMGNNGVTQDAVNGSGRLGDYTVIDHTYDAIVVGAGGAGLRVRLSFKLIL